MPAIMAKTAGIITQYELKKTGDTIQLIIAPA
jgi:hypothetical protein